MRGARRGASTHLEWAHIGGCLRRYLFCIVPFVTHCQWVGAFDSFGALEGGQVDAAAVDADVPDAQDASCMLVLPDNPCALFPSCGCDAGDNCRLIDQSGRTECIPAGSTPRYNACTDDRDCVLGSGCTGGVCKPYCLKDADCKGANRLCLEVTYNGIVVRGASSCSAGCDIFDASAICGPNLGCYGDTNLKGQCTPDCIGPVGSKTGPSANCTTQEDCAPGYQCISSGPNAGACSKWCTDNSQCTSPAKCVYFVPNCKMNNTSYGTCN